MATLDDIAAKVKAEGDVVDSAIALIQGLKDKLDAAIASGADPSQLQALSDAIGAQTSKLAGAVAATTPASTPAAETAASAPSTDVPSTGIPAVDNPAPATPDAPAADSSAPSDGSAG